MSTPRSWTVTATNAALGVFAAGLFWAFYRIVTTKFPIDFVSPVYAAIALCGLALGARPPAASPRRSDWAYAAGCALLLAGCFAHKDQSLHYLLFALYYEYPAPSGVLSTIGFGLSLLLSPLPFFLTMRRLRARLLQPGAPEVWLGAAVGLIVSDSAIPAAGAYAVLAAAMAGLTGLTLNRFPAAAVALTCLLIGPVAERAPASPFLWHARDAKLLDRYWTPLYKADFVSFDNGHCIGSVRNEIMFEYTCDSPDKLPLTHLEMTRAIAQGGPPRRRILTLGRPSGVLASAHRALNPHLEEAIVVDADAHINRDLSGRFSPMTGDIFAPGSPATLVTSDMRKFIDRADKGFDVIYIDGIGLMLVPFPLTLIQAENFVYSREAYRRLFGLLGRDGLLVIDRGTTRTGEADDLRASLPKDVYARALFTKIPNFPFTGLSLVFVLASRNRGEVDRVVDQIVRGRVFAESPLSLVADDESGHDDNWPFFQRGAIMMFFIILLPFTIASLIATRGAWRECGAGGAGAWAAFAGTVATTTLVWLTTVGARTFESGPQTGFVWTAAMVLCGGAISGLLAGVPPIGLVVLTAGSLAGALLVPQAPAAWAMLTGFCGGAAVGAISRAATRRLGIQTALPWLWGAIFGLFTFQWGLLAAGFRGLAVILVVAVSLCAFASRGTSRMPPQDRKQLG